MSKDFSNAPSSNYHLDMCTPYTVHGRIITYYAIVPLQAAELLL